ncbi:hypothetical protein WJX81_004630 [Elliptochloris bilobata]|uniref:Uncharacterized protein n=1 Tax=Elliptochloris bilobata TaxID=381761 RepID=A0AAW1S941_9CHLO
MSGRNVVSGPEDPLVAIEGQFEAARRFVDDWLLQLRDCSQRLESELLVPGSANVRPEEWAPCKVAAVPTEWPSPQGLLRSGNAAFNKLGSLLTYLSTELEMLQRQAEAEFYPALLLFGEGPGGVGGEGAAQKGLARLLPALRALAALLTRLEAAAANLLGQLGALCCEQTRKATILQGKFAGSAFRALAEALGVLVRLEAIIGHNRHLHSAFAMFRRMLQTVQDRPDEFGAGAAADAAAAAGPAGALQERLLGRGVFRRFLEAHVARGAEHHEACASAGFLAAAGGILRQEVGERAARLTAGAERAVDRGELVGLLALGVVYARLTTDEAPPDRRLIRLLLDLHEQVPLLEAFQGVPLQPAAFLSLHLPPTLDALVPPTYTRQAAALRPAQLAQLREGLPAAVGALSLDAAAWLSRFDALMAPHRSSEASLTRTAAAAVRGLHLAAAARARAQAALALHAAAGAPLPRELARPLASALCLAAALRGAFAKHGPALAEALPHLVTHARSGLLGLLAAAAAGVRARLRQMQTLQPLLQTRAGRERVQAALLDAAAAIDAAQHVVQGPASSAHLAALATCLDAAAATGQLAPGDLGRLRDALDDLRSLAYLQPLLEQTSSCGYLFFHRGLLAALLADIAAQPAEARRLPLVLAAFCDAHGLLQRAVAGAAELQQAHDELLLAALRRHVLEPLVRSCEADLRLHLAAAERAGAPPQNAAAPTAADPRFLLHLQPLRLPTRALSIREGVEASLAAALHAHAGVAPADWRAYGRMAGLAADKFGLRLAPPALPPRSLSLGLDLLDVLRNMPQFAASYVYSLPAGQFLERTDAAAAARHLNTLGLPGAAAALGTHGLALADAVVDAAYRFLTHQLAVLSQVLYQDAVKARLGQEAAASAGARPYSVGQAERLAADFQRLGLAPDGLPYLPYLRRLVTGIGNALGLAAAVAAAELDAAAAELCGPAAEGPDYFAVLARVCRQGLAGPSQAHLSSLFAAAPALSLDAVEAALLGKEALAARRTGAPEAGFTDDGFALGLTFLLKVLRQEADFDALHWLRSAAGHFAGLAPGGRDPQGAALLAAKMGRYAAEFELQQRTVACARGVLHSVDDVLLAGDAA